MNQSPNKVMKIADSKEEILRILKELEFILKQSLSPNFKASKTPDQNIKLHFHSRINFEEFLEYVQNSASFIFQNNDLSISQMFLHWILEIDIISAEIFEKIISENKDQISQNLKHIKNRIVQNSFSRLSIFENSNEFRYKYLAYVDLFVTDLEQIPFLYVYKEDKNYNSKLLQILISKDLFKSLTKQSSKLLIDLNRMDPNTLLEYIKIDVNLEKAFENLTLNLMVSPNEKIEQYLSSKLIQKNPMLQYVPKDRRDIALLTAQLEKGVDFSIEKLKDFLRKYYGMKGHSLAKSFMKHMKYCEPSEIHFHPVAGGILKKLFDNYKNNSNYEVPFSNYIIRLLNDDHVIKCVIANKETIQLLTEVLTPHQLFKLLDSISPPKYATVLSCLNYLRRILSSDSENKKRFFAFLETKHFFEYNSWALFDELLKREDFESNIFNKSLLPETSPLRGLKNYELGDGYELVPVKDYFDLADLRFTFGRSLIRKYYNEYSGLSFFTIEKNKKSLFFLAVGPALEDTLLFNGYVVSNRPAEDDSENYKANIEFGDDIVLDCISFNDKKYSNSVFDLPNPVFKNMCIAFFKFKILSEKYFWLSLKAKTMTKDFIFDLKEQNILPSIPMEILTWQLEKVFKKDVEDKSKVPEVIKYSLLDENLKTVSNLFARQNYLIKSITMDEDVSESVAKDFVSYICDFNLQWDTDFKLVSEKVHAFKSELLKDVITEINKNGKTFPELLDQFKYPMLLSRVIDQLRSNSIVLFDGDIYVLRKNVLNAIYNSFENHSRFTWDDIKHVYPINKEVLRQVVSERCICEMKKSDKEWKVIYKLLKENDNETLDYLSAKNS